MAATATRLMLSIQVPVQATTRPVLCTGVWTLCELRDSV